MSTKICQCKQFVAVNTSVCPPYCLTCFGFLRELTYSELRGVARHARPIRENQKILFKEMRKKYLEFNQKNGIDMEGYVV